MLDLLKKHKVANSGIVNIENSLATITVGLALGLKMKYIKEKLENFKGIKADLKNRRN